MMKKLCVVFLACALLFSVFSLIASAEEEPTWVFDVNGVNGKIAGEDAYIFTTQEAYEGGNPNWAVTILLEVQDNGLLKVKQAPISGAGAVPDGVKIGNGVVALVVHSAGSDAAAKDQYANVESKLAAKEVTAGMYILLSGIDLDAGTGSGTASLYATAPTGTPVDDPSEEPSDEPSEEPSDEPSEEPSEEPSSEDPAPESSEPDSASEPADAESSAPESSTPESSAPVSSEESAAPSENDDDSSDSGSIIPIVVIVIAVVAIVASAVVVVIKRKK